ncbi:MAG: hypothetical protein Q7K40_05525 [bacterium]|nr:hypothetical protein [bacterium]
MEKIKEYRGIIIIALIILAFSFYWFETRPSLIKKDCYNEAKESAVEKAKKEDLKNGLAAEGGFMEGDYNSYYKWCLQSKGL